MNIIILAYVLLSICNTLAITKTEQLLNLYTFVLTGKLEKSHPILSFITNTILGFIPIYGSIMAIHSLSVTDETIILYLINKMKKEASDK